MTAGVIFILLLGLCFTPYPSRAYQWLGQDSQVLPGAPRYIVLLGGGGIPSESGLVRTYYAAEAGHRFPEAPIIVALPAAGNLQDSALAKMKEELRLRGIQEQRILLESKGRNTREQALNIRRMLDRDVSQLPVLLVTSPDHLKRALLTFRKVGFRQVAGSAAFSKYSKADVSYQSKNLGGRETDLLPEVGDSPWLRYSLWANMTRGLGVVRELCALAYYKLRGWI